MHVFESWWHRTPVLLRFTLMMVSIVAAVLGGGADGYWD